MFKPGKSAINKQIQPFWELDDTRTTFCGRLYGTDDVERKQYYSDSIYEWVKYRFPIIVKSINKEINNES